MANHVSHASLPYPVKNARFTIQVPYLDADGDPTDPTTPDTECSQDGGSFADCTEEMTTISGSNGTGYITLTGAETNNSMIAVAAKVASGPKATIATLYPRNLPILESGTAGAGASGTLTLASGTYTGLNLAGCFVRTTGGTGGGGTGGANNQARRITSYNTGTRVATVTPNWETTPDSTTTYDVLLPDGILVPMLTALAPTTLARTLVVDSAGLADANAVKLGPTGSGTAQTARDIGASVLLSSGTSTGQLDFTSGVVKANATQFAGQTITCSGGVTIPAATLASTTNITGGTITTVTTVTNQLTAAQIATGVWQDATAGDFTTASSIGKSLYTSGVVPGGSGGLFIAGTNAATTVTTSFTTTFTGNLTGSVASVTGSVGSVTGAVGSVTGAVGSVTGAVGSVTGNVGGNVVGSVASVTGAVGSVTGAVGSVGAGGIAASTFAAGAIDATAIATDALGALELAAGAAAEIAAAVWDLAVSGHTTSGTFGAALNSAGSAGDPWSTALPGAYSSGTAGYILGHNISAVLADGVTHGGTTAKFRLGSTSSTPAFYATNSGGPATVFEATGGNNDGFRNLGFGSGTGYYSAGGATGDGWTVRAGATSGHGTSVAAYNASGNAQYCYANSETVWWESLTSSTWELTTGGQYSIFFASQGYIVSGTCATGFNAFQILDDTGHAGVSNVAHTSTERTAIATAVNTTLTSGHGSGSWQTGSGGGSLTGAYTVTITVDDGSNPIENALVRLVSNIDDTGALVADVNGEVTVARDAATYTVIITRPGYVFTPTTLAVAGDTTQTYSMSAVAVTPSSAGQVTGYLTCLDAAGNPAASVDVFSWQAGVAGGDTGFAYDAAERSSRSGNTGLIQFAGLVPGQTYLFRRGAKGPTHTVQVPTGAADPFELPSMIGKP